jgi:glycosyltransferase involved in cell wall biosynthesis
MKILHYTLGRAPYRSGGLTAWSEDLMTTQVQQGHEVSLLFPGEITLLRKKISIRPDKSTDAVKTFRLVNPLPVPLIYGIDSAKHYLSYDRTADFSKFFEEGSFDVIHLHTLMGLPLEFLQQAKALGIRVVYTTHDTFGVWPEPDLGDTTNDMDSIFSLGYIGNQKVLRYRAIIVMQSKLYKLLKNTSMLKRVKTILRRSSTSVVAQLEIPSELNNQAMYVQLRAVYKDYFALIDTIHFNSELTKQIFTSYGIMNPSYVVEVYHTHMAHAVPAPYAMSGKARILFNGTREQYKGYPLLLSVLDELYAENKDAFTLVVYGTTAADREYVEAHESYQMSALHEVYKGITVTVVPSVYYETFGMVVAESLSFGVPVIVSRTVGGQSLIRTNEYGSVFSSADELKRQLRSAITHPKVRPPVIAFDANETYQKVLGSYISKDAA